MVFVSMLSFSLGDDHGQKGGTKRPNCKSTMEKYMNLSMKLLSNLDWSLIEIKKLKSVCKMQLNLTGPRVIHFVYWPRWGIRARDEKSWDVDSGLDWWMVATLLILFIGRLICCSILIAMYVTTLKKMIKCRPPRLSIRHCHSEHQNSALRHRKLLTV
jgi:hypothetical protein